MSLPDNSDKKQPQEVLSEQSDDDLAHQRKVRRLLEEKLEKKRLKQELGDDFDWLDDEQ